MMTAEIVLPSPHDVGTLNIKQLKRFWQSVLLNRDNSLHNLLRDEWPLNIALLNTLGLGLEQTMVYIYQQGPSFAQFEQWIIESAGTPDTTSISRFNAVIDGKEQGRMSADPVLSAADLDFFNENGYLVIKNAIPEEDCRETIKVICDFLEIDETQPESWYKPNPARQGIMVQLFQHPILSKNRSSVRIRQAFEQLWGTTNIWMNNDRVGFNPPENKLWKFPGPDLHWDCSLDLPIPFGLQGILYLSDTAANQGAFTLVPGFHHRIESWLQSLPPVADPRLQDLHALGSKPITGKAGDFIIWQQALQHGSSPNTSTVPRFVQYICYKPVEQNIQRPWR